ncbi:hypothetical protein CRE_11383 [Caenorhabditis remanei]|uniref:Uncharacterized protein n=1 Tax=Caenorhabditis remanei TaxID=31234 RepID=E3N752_CAERE|nr:hypothetical protein CRE_11383 [Caenorhabditis remanei]
MAMNLGMNDTVSAQLFKDYTIMYNYFLYMFGRNSGQTTDMLPVCKRLDTHHKIVEREHWSKIPYFVEKDNGQLVTIDGVWL